MYYMQSARDFLPAAFMMEKKQPLWYNSSQRRLLLKGEPRQSKFEPSCTLKEKKWTHPATNKSSKNYEFLLRFYYDWRAQYACLCQDRCYCVDIKIETRLPETRIKPCIYGHILAFRDRRKTWLKYFLSATAGDVFLIKILWFRRIWDQKDDFYNMFTTFERSSDMM